MSGATENAPTDRAGEPENRQFAASSPEPLKFPLSFAEQRLWLLDRLEPGKSVYNVSEAMRFTGRLQVAALEKAINEIVRRHESLRTTFTLVEGRPMQIVAPSLHVPMTICDLQHQGAQEREQAAAHKAADLAGTPFDLEQGPLLRATLFVLQPDEHVLLLVMHHIVSEGGWSMSVFLREMGILYNAYSLGQNSPLPELPIQYGDYSVWQRDALQGPVLQPHLSYWKSHLEGSPALVNWPAGRQRPAAQTYNGARQSIFLSKDLKDALNALSRKEGVTTFMTLLAAFQTLLFRITGQEDLVVGVPVAGRTTQTQDLIGLFLNTIALRTRFSGEVSFREFMKQVRQIVFDGLAHQDLPFELLVKAMAPVRSLAFTPLFQVMFAFQNAPHTELKLAGIATTPFEVEINSSMFDLTFFAWEKPDGLKIVFEYSTDLFERATIDRMLAHLQVVLEGIVRNPEERLSRLPLLTEPERRQLIGEWNQTQTDYQLVCAHQLFEAQRATAPNAIAAVQGSRQWTYAELNRQSDRIAGHLKNLGAGPGKVVAICVERSLEMLAALLGIWKTGAAYLPLDPSYPKHRLSFILNDAGPAVLLTERDLRGLLPESAAIVALLDECCGDDGHDSSAPAVGQIDSLAYLIYTSGSTGKPKGVAVGHRALTNLLQSISKHLDPDPHDHLLAVTTISFDIAGLELFLPLISGGRVEIVSREVASDGVRLAAAIEESGATIMQATPATWQMLLDAGWEAKKGLKMVCGGEAMPKALAQRLLKEGRLWNVYGPTETTIWSTVAELSPDDGDPCIGRPIANTQLYVLDRERQPVPVGVSGELYIGGDGLAEGYWKHPELTAEKFVPNPFESTPRSINGSRLYATGDLVRYRRNGDLEYLGRIDDQVKIRGFRIELGEIEAVLDRHDSVGRCIVVVREDIPGDKTLVAYFESRSGSTPDIRDLRAHIKKDLPDYMVPSVFVPIEKLPMTPNGKIDRKALPTTGDHSELRGDFAAPRDTVEQALTRAWSKILRVKEVGIHDNFFDLGGHSLAAVRVLHEIQKASGKILPLATFFQAPTVAALADILRKDGWTPSWSSLVPVRPSGSKPPLFLVHAHGGNVLEYHSLVSSLSSDQPVYAFQARGLDGHIKKGTSIEKMASAYIDELRSFQPEGPYLLGGFCFGGLLALEMAQQLAAAGQEIPLVMMIQSMHPDSMRFKPGTTVGHRWWYLVKARMSQELENISHKGIDYIPERFRHIWNIASARFAIAFHDMIGKTPKDLSRLPKLYVFEALRIEHNKAMDKFEPHAYGGRVTVFRASKQVSGLMADEYLGWKRVLHGDVDVCEVPGWQQTLFADHNVAQLAREFDNRLKAAQQRLNDEHPGERTTGVNTPQLIAN